MERDIYRRSFNRHNPPKWECPTCRKGTLQLDFKSFKNRELASSRDHSHEAWEPDWVHSVYSCLLQCSNEDCLEVVSSVGIGYVEVYDYEDNDGSWVQECIDYFKPTYFQPPLNLITSPKRCPKSITTFLDEASALFFASPEAALNSIRKAVEGLLDDIKIKRFRIEKQKRRLISLHQRIQSMPAKYSDEQEMLMAIKWLGNAGSHMHTSVITEDVMNAIDLIEHVLASIYSNKSTLARLAKRVNKRRGPSQ